MPKKIILTSLISMLLAGLLFHSNAHAQTYYSKPNGSGSTCSSADPCSLDGGLAKLSAGDTLYLHGGTYRQQVYFTKSGDDGEVITIAGYPGEVAVIDGYNTIPPHWGALFDLLGNWVTIKDLEIKDSYSMGLVMRGDHNSAINLYVHGNYENGILVSAIGSTEAGSGKHALIDGCRVYYNCKEERLGLRSDWASGCSLQQGASDGVIRNCEIWENAGEGLSVFSYDCDYPTDNALVEGNVVYDNKSANLYLQNTRHTVVQRNIVYSTKSNWGTDAGGIQIQNELSCNHNDANKILNNFVMNANYHNLVRWYSNKAGGSFTNWVIAGNTFVNANTSNCVMLEPGGTPYNNLIANNIFIQQDSSEIANVPPGYATWKHNLWSKDYDPDVQGTRNLIGDPRIKGGSWGAGTLTADYFKIDSESPARDAGMVLKELEKDFFGTIRNVGGIPDMGGHEYTKELENPLVPPQNFRVVD